MNFGAIDEVALFGRATCARAGVDHKGAVSAELAELEGAIKQAASDMMVQILDRAKSTLSAIRSDIRQQLAIYEPSKEVLDRFPWFTPTSLANTYCEALQISDKPGEVGLVVDVDLLLEAKLPGDLADILEFGTDITPMFPHLRAGMALLERELSAITDSTNR